MRVMALLAAMVFTPNFASAEVSFEPNVRFGFDFLGGFGYKEPGYSFGVGTEINSPLTWTVASVTYRPSDKAIYGNTYSYSGSFVTALRLPKGFLVGGGIGYTKLVFVDLETEKEAVRPQVLVGWEYKNVRLLFYRSFNGRDVANNSEGYGFKTQIHILPQLRMTSGITVATFDTYSYQPERGRTTSVGTSVDFTYFFTK